MLYINFAFLRKVNIKEYLLYYFEFFFKTVFFLKYNKQKYK